MSTIPISHPLDWNGHYWLKMDYDSDKKELSGHIEGPVGTTGTVERHLIDLVGINVNGEEHKLSLANPLRINNKPTPAFRVPVNDADGACDIKIHLGRGEDKTGEIYGSYRIRGERLERKEAPQRLTVFETRMLGNESLYRWLPYPREHMRGPVQRTDLHTHSSAQISAQGLIDIACKHHIPYPTRLLDELHIRYNPDQIVNTERFYFPPADGGDPSVIPKKEPAVDVALLDDQCRFLLEAALAVPPDRQMTFGDLEQHVYRNRYPITKHPDAAYDLWLKVAQEYKSQGITYAEITAVSTSFLKPENLEYMHKILPEIEEATRGKDNHGVKLRFLVGIPRNLPSETIRDQIEKIKIMGASPYIVGVDFMGFEDNKIGDLDKPDQPYIESLAKWAVKEGNDPDFTLRIHAGENRKNITNVKESLLIAEKYGMRVRIGHAVHGLDKDAIAIAKRLGKRAVIEFNPDSNMALNNIDTAEELGMLRCLDEGIPFVICSDGGGLYQTDARQLWTAASFAAALTGIKQNWDESVIQSEQEHMALEDRRFEDKFKALPSNSEDFFDHIRTAYRQLPAVPPPEKQKDHTAEFHQHLESQNILYGDDTIAAATAGKQPLMILGATGKRYWDMIAEDEAQRTNVEHAIECLVEQLNPDKVYFMIGRPKPEGITPLLSNAVKKYNETHKEKFTLISATVQADQTMQHFTPGITHVMPLTGSLFSVPNQLVEYVKQHNGHLLCVGGGTFVRDAILLSGKNYMNIPFGLMNGPQGASSEKAIMVEPEHLFEDADSLIHHLKSKHREWLRTEVRQGCAL